MSYLIHLSFLFLFCFSALASVKDYILSDCKQAITEVSKLTSSERKETLQFIERILSVDPEVSPSVSIKLVPSAQQFAISDDLRKSLIPARDPEAIECALKLLPSLLPESISLLPLMIKQAVEPRTSHEIQSNYEKSSIELIKDAILKKVPLSPSFMREVVLLLKGQTASLAQVVLLEIGEQAIPELLFVSTSAENDLFQMIVETNRIIKSDCNDSPDILSKMLASVDDTLRLRALQFFTQCSEIASKVRASIIGLLSDNNIEVRRSAASIILKFLENASEAELFQIISLVDYSEWNNQFIPFLNKNQTIKGAFHKASIERMQDVSPQIALRILDVTFKDDIKILQSFVEDKKIPAFLRVASAHALLSKGLGVENVSKLIAEKPSVISSDEDRRDLIQHLLSVQYLSQYREDFINILRSSKNTNKDTLEAASKNVLPKFTTKEMEVVIRNGNTDLLLELLGKVKLSDPRVISLLLREAFNDTTPKNRVLWGRALSLYSKEIKSELSKKLKGSFDPTVYLYSAAIKLLSKQQLGTALLRDDYTCEERMLLHQNLSESPENRDYYLKSLTLCLQGEETEFVSSLISKLKPFSESEEEKIISSLLSVPSNSRSITAISLPFEFSLNREEKFISSIFENASPIETRDLLRALSGRAYISTPLVAQAKKIYESSSDEALRYEALKLITKHPYDGFDTKDAVRSALRDSSNLERGILLLQSMRPEEASLALAQSLRDLPIERLRRLIEIVPSLGIHDPALMGAVDEVSARISDPETQYRLAAMRIALNPTDPDSEKKLEKYFSSRYAREFRSQLMPFKNNIKALLEKLSRSSQSASVRGMASEILSSPVPENG